MLAIRVAPFMGGDHDKSLMSLPLTDRLVESRTVHEVHDHGLAHRVAVELGACHIVEQVLEILEHQDRHGIVCDQGDGRSWRMIRSYSESATWGGKLVE